MGIKQILKIPVYVLIWLGFMFLIKLPVALLGLVVTPILYEYRAEHYEYLPWWSRPWANPEDWTGGPQGSVGDSLPLWWIAREGNDFKAFFKYHAIRNPANGLRSIEALDLDIDPVKMGFYTPFYMPHYEPWAMRKTALVPSTVWYLAWQGWKAGFKLVHLWSADRHLVIKLGWRIQPSDKTVPIDPDGIRVEDAGFASKVLLYRKG